MCTFILEKMKKNMASLWTCSYIDPASLIKTEHPKPAHCLFVCVYGVYLCVCSLLPSQADVGALI